MSNFTGTARIVAAELFHKGHVEDFSMKYNAHGEKDTAILITPTGKIIAMGSIQNNDNTESILYSTYSKGDIKLIDPIDGGVFYHTTNDNTIEHMLANVIR